MPDFYELGYVIIRVIDLPTMHNRNQNQNLDTYLPYQGYIIIERSLYTIFD